MTSNHTPRTALHHLAIATASPLALAEWYAAHLLRGCEPTIHRTADGQIRSVWLVIAHGVILMFEVCPPRVDAAAEPVAYLDKAPGYHLLSFRILADERAAYEESLQAAGIAIEHRSEFSLYVRDPDGNRVALSCYDLPET